jgi:hypothetical protein
MSGAFPPKVAAAEQQHPHDCAPHESLEDGIREGERHARRDGREQPGVGPYRLHECNHEASQKQQAKEAALLKEGQEDIVGEGLLSDRC